MNFFIFDKNLKEEEIPNKYKKNFDKVFKKKISKIKENVDKQEVFNASISEIIKKLEIEENSDYEEIDNKKRKTAIKRLIIRMTPIKRGSLNLMKIKKWQ